MVDLVRRPTRLEAEFEVVLARAGVGEKLARRLDLVGRGVMGRTRDRDLVLGEVVARTDERQRLQRLRGGPHEADEIGVAGARDDLAATHRDGMHAMPCLDDSVPSDIHDDGFAHKREDYGLVNGRDLSYVPPMPTKDGHDYAAKETMVVADPKQLKAMADPLRTQLIQLLRDRARSTQEIAVELGLPKGTVGHHLKVLESAGLIRVVRTRKVRAMTEKFYGRTARLFLYHAEDPADGRAISANTLRSAASEVEQAPHVSGFGLVRARLTKNDIDRFDRRAKKLLEDFRLADTPGAKPWSMTTGLWSMEADDA